MLEVPVYLHPLRQPREVLCPILQAYVAFFEATLADLASTTGSLSVGEAMEQPLTVQRVTTKARHRRSSVSNSASDKLRQTRLRSVSRLRALVTTLVAKTIQARTSREQRCSVTRPHPLQEALAARLVCLLKPSRPFLPMMGCSFSTGRGRQPSQRLRVQRRRGCYGRYGGYGCYGYE